MGVDSICSDILMQEAIRVYSVVFGGRFSDDPFGLVTMTLKLAMSAISSPEMPSSFDGGAAEEAEKYRHE